MTTTEWSCDPSSAFLSPRYRPWYWHQYDGGVSPLVEEAKARLELNEDVTGHSAVSVSTAGGSRLGKLLPVNRTTVPAARTFDAFGMSRKRHASTRHGTYRVCRCRVVRFPAEVTW